MDTFLTILKFIAIGLAGVFGYVALLGENRDETGRLTKWGKLAIVGVVLSTLIAFVTQAFEAKIQQVAEKAAMEDNRRRLELLTRAAYPLQPADPLKFGAEFSLRLTNAAVRPYVERISKLASKMVEARQSHLPLPLDTELGGDEIAGWVVAFKVNGRSPFMGQPDEPLAYYLTRDPYLLVRFKKQPSNQAKAKVPSSDSDLRFFAHISSGTGAFYYDVNTKTLILNAVNMQIDTKSDWISNGSILSITDLADARMFLVLGDYLADNATPEDRRVWDDLRNTTDYTRFELRAAGRFLFATLSETDAIITDTNNPLKLVLYTFPHELPEDSMILPTRQQMDANRAR